MGMFDDLIPIPQTSGSSAGSVTSAESPVGMFDDLIPKAEKPEKPGFLARVADAFTGASRTEFPDAPEFLPALMKAGNISVEDAQAGREPAFSPSAVQRSAITSDPAAALDILRKHIPGLEAKQDKHGNLMLKAPGMTDWAYLNKPGLSARDFDELGTQTLATLPFLGAAGQGASIPARIASGAGFMGAGELERQGLEKAAGSEQGPDDNRLALATGLGVLAPGVPSAAAGAVADVAKGAVRPLTNLVRSARAPEDEAARQVAEAFAKGSQPTLGAMAQRRGLPQVGSPEELQHRASGALQEKAISPESATTFGGDVRVMDIGGEPMRALARQASNTSSAAREQIGEVINSRFGSQAERVSETLGSLADHPLTAGKTREELEKVANQITAPAYEETYKAGAGGVNSPLLTKMHESPTVQEAIVEATKAMADKAASGRVVTSDKGPLGRTMEFWDQVKRAIGDKITRAQAFGDKEKAADLIGLQTKLVGELDRLVPSYKDARGVAEHFFGANNALSAGEKFATNAARYGNEEARAAVAKFSPNERALFERGYIDRTIASLRETSDRRNVLAQLGHSPAARERMEIALGAAKAQELEATLHIEKLQDLVRGAMGNSTTARQLWEMGLAGSAGAAISGFDPHDPVGWITAFLTHRGLHRVGARVDVAVAEKVAQALVSRDPAIMRKGAQLAAGNKPIMEALRRLDDAVPAGARNIAAQASTRSSDSQQPNAMRSSAAHDGNAMAPDGSVADGATATNHETGERVRRVRGRWVPLQQ